MTHHRKKANKPVDYSVTYNVKDTTHAESWRTQLIPALVPIFDRAVKEIRKQNDSSESAG